MKILVKQTYFVSMSVVIQRHKLYHLEKLLDTGDQPNLITKDLFPDRWTVHQQAAGNVHLRSASSDSMHVIGKMTCLYELGIS